MAHSLTFYYNISVYFGAIFSRQIKIIKLPVAYYYYYSFICIYETSTHTKSSFAKCTFANESNKKTFLQVSHITRIFLKSIKFPLTHKSLQGSLKTRKNMQAANYTIWGRFDKGFCLEIAKFWTQTYNSDLCNLLTKVTALFNNFTTLYFARLEIRKHVMNA